MFDDLGNFLKQDVLNPIETVGKDIGHAVSGAVSDVGNLFSGGSQSPQAPQQQVQRPTQLGGLTINNPLSVQNQQSTQQNPMLKLNFGQNQNPQQQAPQQQSQQLNTNLVNFNKPLASVKTPADSFTSGEALPPQHQAIFNNLKTQALPGSFGQTPQTQPSKSGGGGINFINNVFSPIKQEAKTLETSPLGTALRVGVANLTGNPGAAQNARLQSSNPIITGLSQPATIIKNGKRIINPTQSSAVFGTTMGAGEGNPVEGEGAVPNDTPGIYDKAGKALEPTKNLTPEGNVPFSPEDIKVLESKLAEGGDQPKENLAELSPAEQMAKFKQNETPLNEPSINTARNPFKADIPQVEQGDYGQVVANEQAASKPIQFAGDRWEAAMKKLNPDEKTNFWRSVEKPDDPTYSDNLNDAIDKWRQVDDRIHGTSQALGGNTNFLTDHALHPWDLPEGFGDHVVNGGDPDKFPGINNISRKYRTIAEGEANGLKLKDDPIKEGQDYIGASATLLKRRAIIKGTAEADAGETEKPHLLQVGRGKDSTIEVSDKGKKALRGLQRSLPTTNKAVVELRTANTALKSSILSAGQFHPINISLLRAGPTLALPKPSMALFRDDTGSLKIDPTMGAHPVRAIKGMAGTFRNLLPGGKEIAEQMKSQAVKDGMDIKAAKIGAPYGTGGFDTEGSVIKNGIGHETVFGKQMPMMHDQVVRSVVSDLKKRGISLDSPEARTAGKAANNLMGFVNAEAQKIPPQVNRSLGDFLLAKQFTASKFSQDITAVSKGGVGGAYARANVAANIAAAGAIIVGLGSLAHQKSDSTRDMLLRALVHPAVPTPFKDNKGNNINLRLPATDTSDLASLLGISLNRQSNGHLGVSWKPSNVPSDVSYFAQARLSPFLSAGVNLKTNKTFAGYPVYNSAPGTSTGKKIAQGAFSTATGVLPIGIQGLPQTKTIKGLLPQSLQQIEGLQKAGGNPLVKSIGSSFGLTPSTDMTVGQGRADQQFYATKSKLESAVAGNPEATDAINAYLDKDVNSNGQKVDHSPQESIGIANLVAGDPSALKALKSFEASQPNHDPMWNLSDQDLRTFMSYQGTRATDSTKSAMPIADGSFNNGQGLGGFIKQRDAYYNNSPTYKSTSIVNPQTPTYPTFQGQQGTDYQAYENTVKNGTSAEKSAYLNAHPDVVDAMAQLNTYYNKLGVAQGGLALKNAPNLTPLQQSALTYYDSLPKSKSAGNTSSTSGERSAWIKANPTIWNQITQVLAQGSLQSTSQLGATEQYQGVPYTSKYLTGIKQLGSDIATSNGQDVLNPSLAYTQGSSSGSGSSSSDPLVAMPKVKHFKQPKQRKSPKLKGFRAPHVKKAQRIKIQTQGLKPTQVARPTSVVKLATR